MLSVCPFVLLSIFLSDYFFLHILLFTLLDYKLFFLLLQIQEMHDMIFDSYPFIAMFVQIFVSVLLTLFFCLLFIFPGDL